MALKAALEENEDGSPKTEDAVKAKEEEDKEAEDDALSTVWPARLGRDDEVFHADVFNMQERKLAEKARKLKEKQDKVQATNMLMLLAEVAECSAWLKDLGKGLEAEAHTLSCIEKRQAVKVASSWEFHRMVGAEVNFHGSRLAWENLRCFIVFRARRVKDEISLGTSWTIFLKMLWYKLIGKSFAWEVACEEVKEALVSNIDFLKSEEGWGADFNKNMKNLLKQPF